MAGDEPMLFTQGEKSLIITGAVLATVLIVVALFAFIYRLMDPPPPKPKRLSASRNGDGEPPKSPGGYMEPVDPPVTGKFAAFKPPDHSPKKAGIILPPAEPVVEPKPPKKSVSFETPKRSASTRSEMAYDNGEAFNLSPVSRINPAEDEGNNAVTWNEEDEFAQDEIFSADEQARIWAELRAAEEEAARGGSGAAERAAEAASSAMGTRALSRSDSKSFMNETLGKDAALPLEEMAVLNSDPEYIDPNDVSPVKTFDAESAEAEIDMISLPEPVSVAFGTTGDSTLPKGASLPPPPAEEPAGLAAVAEDDEEETFGFGAEVGGDSRRTSMAGGEEPLSPTYISVTDPNDAGNTTVQLPDSPDNAGNDDGPDYIAVNDPVNP